jgi:hypothetical protein
MDVALRLPPDPKQLIGKVPEQWQRSAIYRHSSWCQVTSAMGSESGRPPSALNIPAFERVMRANSAFRHQLYQRAEMWMRARSEQVALMQAL